MVRNLHSMPIYRHTSLVDVQRVEFSRSICVPQEPYLSTVVDEGGYPGTLARGERNWSNTVQINKSTTLPPSTSKFTMVYKYQIDGTLASHTYADNMVLQADQVKGWKSA